MSLVEDSPQGRPTNIGKELKISHEIGTDKNSHCGAQTLQGIKGLLIPVIPYECYFLIAHIFSGYQLMQGSSYLHELWNELSVMLHKPQKTSDLGDISKGRPFLHSVYLTLIGGYTLGRDNMPQVGNLPSEQLTFGRFEF